jgi:hypothetical protein
MAIKGKVDALLDHQAAHDGSIVVRDRDAACERSAGTLDQSSASSHR